MKWKRPKPASSNPFSSAPSSSKPSRPWAANCGRASRAATRSPTSPPSSASATARSRAGTRRNTPPPRPPPHPTPLQQKHIPPTPPAITRERDRELAGGARRNTAPVLRRYERICFEKQHVRILDPDHVRVGTPMASLLHPGHPLM